MSLPPVPASFDRHALHEAYQKGLGPDAVMEAAYERLEGSGDPGIFISVLEREAALSAARSLGPFDPVAKPLYGLPFAVKDNIDLEGLDTTAACPAYAYRPRESASAVARLLAAGAIPLGKTNLDQFATGLVGVRTPHPVPRNAFDPEMVPGGSSSGSAVAVARGIVSFALGTDTAGSGRVPAGLNNIVGLKPTIGAIPLHGVVPACKTLDCVSVFALTVPDAWAVLEAMVGPDPRDPWSRPVALGRPGASAPGIVVGVPDARSRSFFGDRLAEAAFEAALADASSLGLTLVEVDLTPFLAVAELLYAGPWVAERYQAIRPFIEASPEALHPVTRAIIEGAMRHSAADAFAGIYRLAELKATIEPSWRRVDALLVPTLPRPYRLADLAADPIAPNMRLGLYTNFVNLLDLCALAVPGRLRADAFPAGVTLIASAGRDAVLAGLGEALHQRAGVALGATGAALPQAVCASPEAMPGEAEIVVVGAHLSGMALNHELTSLGGRFLRTAETTDDYRLYALAGTAPRRPGLLRVAKGTGAPIATEVWALPVDGFGRFVAAIPAPLGVGTVRLADGTAPKGFLCEAVAIDGAEDITLLGGWRAFMRRQAAA